MKNLTVLEQLAGKELSKGERIHFTNYISGLNDYEDINYEESLLPYKKLIGYKFYINDDPNPHSKLEAARTMHVGLAAIDKQLKQGLREFEIKSYRTKESFTVKTEEYEYIHYNKK